MAEDLRTLAAKYVSLTEEIEATRRAMLTALTNGAGEIANSPFAKAERPGGKRSQPMRAKAKATPQATGRKHPNAIAAQAEEARLLDLLKATPGMRPVEIAKAMAARPNTTVQRLERMQERGQVQRNDHGAYSVSAL